MQFHRSNGYTALASVLVVGVLTLAGCSSATSDGDASDNAHGHDHGHDHDHEHGHRPDSLHEAVDHLAEIEEAVSKAIMSGDAEAADEPLHEVVDLLNAIPEIAAETDLPKEEWEAVKAASKRLFNAYKVIHDEFHGKDGKDSDKQAAYEKVSSELTEALEEIRSRLPLTGEEPEDHDHDHGDHDDHDHDHDHSAAEQPASQEGADS